MTVLVLLQPFPAPVAVIAFGLVGIGRGHGTRLLVVFIEHGEVGFIGVCVALLGWVLDYETLVDG